jgi:hypothetical protein
MSSDLGRESGDVRRVEWLDRLAWLLDDLFGVPGTNQRFGLDAIVGLVPGVGDVVGALLSTYIIVQAARLGAPTATIVRMLGNVAVETIIGTVPILGDWFDVVWKANLKNVALLAQALDRPGPPRSSREIMRLATTIIVGSVVVLVAATAALTVALFRLLAG